MGATGTYVRAGLPEVAAALSVLTGEPHPLAPEGSGSELCPPALTAGQTVKHCGERHLPAGDGHRSCRPPPCSRRGREFRRLVALDEYAELRGASGGRYQCGQGGQSWRTTGRR